MKKYSLPTESRLTIIEIRRGEYAGRIRLLAVCKCNCGPTREFVLENVTSGRSLSCGCLMRERASLANRTHGMGKSKSYRAWTHMKTRCGNENYIIYHRYGGRGISVCKEWVSSFEEFYKEVKKLLPNGETDIPCGLSIDRIDNNRGYEPGNIRLATREVQNTNKATNVLISIGGFVKALSEWCRETGIKPATAAWRIRQGWDKYRAVTELPRKNKRWHR